MCKRLRPKLIGQPERKKKIITLTKITITLKSIFSDKSIKPKQKTEMIASWLANQSLLVDELLQTIEKLRDEETKTSIQKIYQAAIKKVSTNAKQ